MKGVVYRISVLLAKSQPIERKGNHEKAHTCSTRNNRMLCYHKREGTYIKIGEIDMSANRLMTRATIIVAGILLAVLVTLSLVQVVNASTITMRLTFDTIVHGRPCQVVVSRHESTLDDSADGPDAPIVHWQCEVIELDSQVTSTVQPTSVPTYGPAPTNGPTITPEPTSAPSAGPYVASKSGTKFHLPSCSHAKRILPDNLVTFASRDLAIAAGYDPCSVCKP